MESLKEMKKSFNKVKNSLIKRLERLSFIERAAEKWNMLPRGAIYVYLSIIALAAGIALFGYIVYLMIIWHLLAASFSDLLVLNGLKVIISIIAFVTMIGLPALNIDNLLHSQKNYVDYLIEADQRRFARRGQHYPE